MSDTATEAGEAISRRAIERYRNDARFRAVANYIVHRAMKEHGRIDPEYADEAAFRIAERATVLLLETIFENDAELKAQRELADHYKKMAEGALMITPLPGPFLAKHQPEP